MKVKMQEYAKGLNRVAKEPKSGLDIAQVREMVIKRLHGKKSVTVDWRKLSPDPDEDRQDKEELEIVQVMKYFTVVKRGSSTTCILHQDMFFIAGIGAR